jgi:hypothetical protein
VSGPHGARLRSACRGRVRKFARPRISTLSPHPRRATRALCCRNSLDDYLRVFPHHFHIARDFFNQLSLGYVIGLPAGASSFSCRIRSPNVLKPWFYRCPWRSRPHAANELLHLRVVTVPDRNPTGSREPAAGKRSAGRFRSTIETIRSGGTYSIPLVSLIR